MNHLLARVSVVAFAGFLCAGIALAQAPSPPPVANSPTTTTTTLAVGNGRPGNGRGTENRIFHGSRR